VLVAILLAVVEAIQIYLPGRTAEITDPVLAVIVGLVLMMLERQSRENAKSPGI
jgi:VanZ family protein